MENYKVSGMSCAACVARVEKAVKATPGVEFCAVNLLTASMSVDGTAKSEDIINAVRCVGYDAAVGQDFQSEDDLKDTETPRLLKRLGYSVGFLLALMYLSMGYTMWHFPLPGFLEKSPLAVGILQMVFSAVLLFINRKFFISGVKGAIKGAPNMDTLVALGSGVSFIYSVVGLFLLGFGKLTLHGLYFESAGMILVLITVGKTLEAYSKGKTTVALKELMALTPKVATVVVDGREKTVDASTLVAGDIFIVKAGGSIPVDGEIIQGECTADEALLTGESLPVDKVAGDKVFAGTVARTGYIKCRASVNSAETVLGEIIKTVKDSAASKAPIARVADRVSGVFVPVVMSIALVTFVIWLFVGEGVGFALGRGISVLVISCPCALGLATPVAIMVGNGVGARNGILFKSATALENAGRTKIVALDKTGTVTVGAPQVTDVIPVGVDTGVLMEYAYSLEKLSEHPLGKAIAKGAEDSGAMPLEVSGFETLAGNGVRGYIDGDEITIGSYKHFGTLATEYRREFEKLSRQGKTPVFVGKNGKIIGIIALRDEIKSDSREAIASLKSMGIKTVLLTGDNENTATAIGNEVGVDRVIAQVLPMEKERVIKDLKQEGQTAMVGDGINDAPALTTADTGIAIGQGTQIAIDTASVVLVNGSLTGVSGAIKLSRATLRNIHENLFWAFIYNVIGIPLAVGAFIYAFGWELSPMFGALAMSLSSFCVVANALRLNFIKLNKEKKNMLCKKKEAGVIIGVEGMMCPHCEARVKSAVEAVEGVERAEPSHKKNRVVVFGDFDLESVKSVIKAQGYEVK